MAMNRDMMAKLAQMQQQIAKAQADLAEKKAEGIFRRRRGARGDHRRHEGGFAQDR